MVDQMLLHNVLNNLLSNAVKYSPEHSNVHFTLQYLPGEIRYTVADSGIGIPAEEQPHLFERFFRASNTEGIGGTGLGLSIVKRYLDLMGGRIDVRSQPGQGTTFTISIPTSQAPEHFSLPERNQAAR
jgi:signal transduction histidine kinase